jgi:hypothetical protein
MSRRKPTTLKDTEAGEGAPGLGEFKAAYDPTFEHHKANTEYPGKPVYKGTQRFLITSAQNATPIVEPFWKSLLHCQRHYNAHLSVIPYRYKNPTSRWTGSQNNAEFWVQEVRDYLCNKRWNINKNLVVVGDIKIVPTAKDPLSGHENFTGAESSIFGHPNLAFTTVATPGHQMAKLMTTTGSCTQPNYSDSRAGKAGEFQHVTGALLVEVEGPYFWVRQLNATDKGEFIDKDLLFTPDGVFPAPPPEALVTGDAHVRQIDKTVERGVFGPKGIVPTLKPKRIIYHDLLDGFGFNHHEKKQWYTLLAKMKAGLLVVKDELDEAVQFVIDRIPTYKHFEEAVIVDSNHDAFLLKWLEENSSKTVGMNYATFNELDTYMGDASHVTDEHDIVVPSPFKYWVDKFKNPKIRCLREDESYSVVGIALDMHGHRGTNGAKGSLKNLVKIGIKFVIGHVHGPGIRFGGYAVGLMAKLRQFYNKGPSNWLHTMCLVHAAPCAGKRQLITIINGRPWL